MKKLLHIIYTPRVSEKTDGVAMRSKCPVSKAPKLSLAHPDASRRAWHHLYMFFECV